MEIKFQHLLAFANHYDVCSKSFCIFTRLFVSILSSSIPYILSAPGRWGLSMSVLRIDSTSLCYWKILGIRLLMACHVSSLRQLETHVVSKNLQQFQHILGIATGGCQSRFGCQVLFHRGSRIFWVLRNQFVQWVLVYFPAVWFYFVIMNSVHSECARLMGALYVSFPTRF